MTGMETELVVASLVLWVPVGIIICRLLWKTNPLMASVFVSMWGTVVLDPAKVSDVVGGAVLIPVAMLMGWAAIKSFRRSNDDFNRNSDLSETDSVSSLGDNSKERKDQRKK